MLSRSLLFDCRITINFDKQAKPWNCKPPNNLQWLCVCCCREWCGLNPTGSGLLCGHPCPLLLHSGPTGDWGSPGERGREVSGTTKGERIWSKMEDCLI